jgi:hypothetical protein
LLRIRVLTIALACSAAWAIGGPPFEIDPSGVVGRSDIILERPNLKPEEAMPLGNGGLGIAVWSAEGSTIQLNRADTLPGRLSPGQVVIPGLHKLTEAPDYSGRVDLFNGEFREHGGGLTANVYVETERDVVVVEVRGADPKELQTAELRLWAPRRPSRAQSSGMALLSETWLDDKAAGASGQTFGSLAALTVEARDARAAPVGEVAERITFRPRADGSFRVLVGAPEWVGGDAVKTSHKLLEEEAAAAVNEHRQWWNDFWKRAGLIRLSSPDGSAEYFENLRTIDLFTAAAERGRKMPGSQAGIADLFSAARDHHQWDPAAYWHWNLRMQVAANIVAGLFDLNEPYFRLYRDNLANIEAWTEDRMKGRPGACVPETMRFNGQGFENEDWVKTPGRNCDAGSPPYYNARTISTGAEVSWWIWRQYLATGDTQFLERNYPVMASAARFLLAYSKADRDGLRHTSPSNAHEQQWDVRDPITDLCAMRTLFPAVAKAARILQRDPDLATEAERALRSIPELPRKKTEGVEVLAESYMPSAEMHNSENLGLEPVWPYSLIGDEGPLHDLSVQTFEHRPHKMENDWNFDPIQAARLGLAKDVKATLIGLTKKYQSYPSGLASFVGPEFYGEQIGVVAAALSEALVQDCDDLLRIAPAWPQDWDGDGTVYVQRTSRVDVQIRKGKAMSVTFEAGYSGTLRLRNPWSGRTFEIAASNGSKVIPKIAGATVEFEVRSGAFYSMRNSGWVVERVTGRPAWKPKSLGERSIGLWGTAVH